MKAFATLERHYKDPMLAAREAKAKGTGIVGLVGNAIPTELVLAIGRFPVLISPKLDKPTPLADHYIDPVVSPETHSLFEEAISGAFEELDLLILTRADDKAWYYLKEMYRLGRAEQMPPLHMFDLMQSRREAVRAYNWKQFEALIDALERAAGEEITDSRLSAAIALTNRSRGLQRKLLAERWKGHVSGPDAMVAIGAGYFMHPTAYADALEAYLAEIAAKPGNADGKAKLLVLTSDGLSYLDLHKRLEAAGGHVAAEDDWWGARAPGGDAPLASSPREAVFQKIWLDTAGVDIAPYEAREAWFLEQAARSDVDGIVFYVPPSDHHFGWDYPRLSKTIAAMGKQQILLRQDATKGQDGALIEAAAKKFVSGLTPAMAR